LDDVDCGLDSHHIEISGADDPEAHPGIVIEVHSVMDRAADTDVDRMVLHQQTLFEGSPKDGAVPHWRVEVGVPGVEMGIEVDQRDGAVNGP
jgi:hypothetical protein